MAFNRLIPSRQLLLAVALGVAYGLCVRLVFGLEIFEEALGVMSVGFIFGAPFGLGFLTIHVAEKNVAENGTALSWPKRLFLPWIPALLALGSALLLAWEGLICIVLWLPLFLLLSSLGGLASYLLRKLIGSGPPNSLVAGCIALLPFAASPIEQRLDLPTELRRVDTQIEIASDPVTVWRHIETVEEIQTDEHSWSPSQLIGFPRPVAATLDRPGVGGIRHATFEGDVIFVETVTVWQPNEVLAFSIHADPESIPAASLDQHVTVGGQFFDVLEGEYRIEPIGEGRVILHLASHYRLSTHFNGYAGWWTDFIMGDVQDYILRIQKRRCEAS